ncbi:MAG: hypothetical protein U1E42_03625 [Rhodospirillales bacterium]
MAERNIAIRLSLQDAEKVKAGLQALGADGQKALQRIEQASQPASRGLLAVNAAAGEVRGRVEQMTGGLGPLGAGLTAIGPAGLAAGAAIAGLGLAASSMVAQTRGALALLDDLGDTAQKLSLTGNELIQLRAVFRESGVETEDFDRAIKTLNERIGDLAVNGENASVSTQRAFATLGIAVTDASGKVKSNGVILKELEDAFARIEDPASRAALAQDLFGKSGAAMANVMARGSAELERLRQELADMGLVIDERLLNQAGELNDRLETLSEIIRLNLAQAFVALGPHIAQFTAKLAEAARNVAAFFDDFNAAEERATATLKRDLELKDRQIAQIRGMIATPPNAIERLVGRDRQKDLAPLLAKAEGERAELARLIGEREAAEGAARTRTFEATRGVDVKPDRGAAVAAKAAARMAEADRQAIAEMARDIVTFADERQQFIDQALGRLSETATDAQRRQVEDYAKQLYDLKQKQEAATRAARQHEQVVSDGKRVFEDTRTPLEDYLSQLARLRELQAQGAIDADTFARAQTAAQERLEEAMRSSPLGKDKAGEEVSLLAEGFKDIGVAASSAFEDAITKGEDLRAVLDGLAQDIQRILTRKLISEPLMAGLDQFLAGVSASPDAGKTGGLFGSWGAQAGSWLAGLFGGGRSMPNTGGPWMGTTAEMFAALHEGGIAGVTGARSRHFDPRLFAMAPRLHGGLMPDEIPAILQRGEAVLTRRQQQAVGDGLRRGGDGRPVNVVMNVSTPDVGGFKASQAQLMTQAARAMSRTRRSL